MGSRMSIVYPVMPYVLSIAEVARKNSVDNWCGVFKDSTRWLLCVLGDYIICIPSIEN